MCPLLSTPFLHVRGLPRKFCLSPKWCFLTHRLCSLRQHEIDDYFQVVVLVLSAEHAQRLRKQLHEPGRLIVLIGTKYVVPLPTLFLPALLCCGGVTLCAPLDLVMGTGCVLVADLPLDVSSTWCRHACGLRFSVPRILMWGVGKYETQAHGSEQSAPSV